MSVAQDLHRDTDRRSRRSDLTRRHIQHHREGTTDQHPDGPRYLPAEEYLDIAIHAGERALFRRVPLVATHSSALPEKRSYCTELLGGVPVLLIRQDDGTVKAFLNVCSHRGARVAEGSGTVDHRLFCPYHGWAYGPAGELRSVMQEPTFGPIDKSCNSLTELPCEERSGLVFVILDPSADLDLDVFLGDIAGHLADAGLAALAPHTHRIEEQRLNWKLALATFLEAYHVKVVHRETVGAYFAGNMATHDLYGADNEHSFTSWTMASIADVAAQVEGGLDVGDVPVAPYLPLIYLHPNTFITSPEFAELALLVRIFPGATPAEQYTDFRIFTAPSMTDEARAVAEQFAGVSVFALENEDYRQAGDVQLSLDTGLVSRVQIGANEPAVTDMHRALARAVGRPPLDRPLPERAAPQALR